MIIYLTKVVLCSGIFWAFYRWVLQREKMFLFNRVYLLLTPLLAVLIPFYQIEVPQPIITEAPEMISITVDSGTIVTEPIISSWSIMDYAYLIYILIAAVLLLRLIINLIRILRSTHQADTYQWREKTIVPLARDNVPYSFLDYIFISESAADQETLLQHEYEHSRQWHSVDIILIEIMQIIFWYNPVLPLYRRSMRLNHEFLADAGTIRHTSTKDYQRLLLQVATAHDRHYLASGFNYFFIKNRLEMMTKTTSTVRRRSLESLAALLLVVMTFFVAERVYAQTANDGATNGELTEFKQLHENSLNTDGSRTYRLSGVNRMTEIWNKMSDAQKEVHKGMLPPPPPPPPAPPAPPSVTPPPPPAPIDAILEACAEDGPTRLIPLVDLADKIRLDYVYIEKDEARKVINSGKIVSYRIIHHTEIPDLDLYTKQSVVKGMVPPPPPPPPAPPAPEVDYKDLIDRLPTMRVIYLDKKVVTVDKAIQVIEEVGLTKMALIQRVNGMEAHLTSSRND